MAMPPIEAPVSAHCLDPLPNRNVTNSGPTRPECPCESGTSFRPGQESDHRHRRPLRARRERPRGHSAAEKRDELPALHSITSSARAESPGGTSRPSALAGFLLSILRSRRLHHPASQARSVISGPWNVAHERLGETTIHNDILPCDIAGTEAC